LFELTPEPDLPSCRPAFEICDSGRPNECVEEATLLCAEKKCWFCDTFRVVEAAAGRPLAEKLSRLGVTGNLPVEKLALRKFSLLIGRAFMRPLPNSLPETVVPPRKCESWSARFTFEKRVPPCSGANPPRL
jgi:hypothetical protein